MAQSDQRRAPSTRAQTRSTGTFLRTTPGSQTLERGLLLLRAFSHGVDSLTNAELAERTGLPRPTVSRLTRPLVDSGFLYYDLSHEGYRLTAACLSLALSYRNSEAALTSALPLMRELAEGRRVNVGLAVVDQLEMVYLDSVRFSRLGIFRRILPGSRIPIANTALGCAFLAGMRSTERDALLARLQGEHGEAWPLLKRQVDEALRAVRDHGYCHAHWSAGMAAVATPLRAPTGQVYAMNVSFPVAGIASDQSIEMHADLLLQLKSRLVKSWES